MAGPGGIPGFSQNDRRSYRNRFRTIHLTKRIAFDAFTCICDRRSSYPWDEKYRMNLEHSKLGAIGDLRLAAIDLDGTLLSADLSISAKNRRAIGKLKAAGVEVVIASGRHHITVRRFAAQLPEVRWIVSVQGCDVSDVTRERVFSQTFLAREEVADLTLVQHQLAVDAVFYTPEGTYTSNPASEGVQFYTSLTGLAPVRVDGNELARQPIYKIIWIGSQTRIDAVATDCRLSTIDAQQVRTDARFLELMPRDVNKATGLAVLSKYLGITGKNVVAFGDAENDIPMFEWAEFSFAMSHGWRNAKARARWVAPQGPPESAFARAVDLLI